MSRAFMLPLIVLALSAQAKEVPYFPGSSTETADGTFISKPIDGGRLYYELIPATDAITATLAATKCSTLMIDGSVLSRSVENDPETHGPDVTTVKILVRRTGACY